MAKKKHKKAKGGKRRWQDLGAGNGAAAPNGQGILGGLSRLLPKRQSEQFLVGALIGAAATYVLADDELRGKLIRAGINLYASVAGGLEEMKEQVADIRAEMAVEQDGLL